MTQLSPIDHAELIEAYRTLVNRLPDGAMVSAYRERGARKAVVTVTLGNGETTRYEHATKSAE